MGKQAVRKVRIAIQVKGKLSLKTYLEMLDKGFYPIFTQPQADSK